MIRTAIAPSTRLSIGATVVKPRPVTRESQPAETGKAGKKAQLFMTTCPCASTGSWAGYPCSAMSRYH
jgi:hypothetical protein